MQYRVHAITLYARNIDIHLERFTNSPLTQALQLLMNQMSIYHVIFLGDEINFPFHYLLRH